MPENNNENSEPIQHYLYITSSYPAETYIKDGDTTNPITVNGTEITVTPGDYVIVKNYQHDDPVVHEWWNDPQYVNDNVAYVYTLNGKWMYVSGGHDYDRQTGKIILGFGRNVYNNSGSNAHFLDGIETYKSEDEIIGNRSNVITTISQWPEGHNTIDINDYTPSYHEYGVDTYYEVPERTETPPITTEAEIGDLAEMSYNYHLEDGEPTWDTTSVIYQYPGVWVKSRNYPDLTVQVPEEKYKGHVQLKWTDPPDITDWKPTPATWEGTVIVRKENSAPLHRWDGEKVVRTTERDKYKTKPYKDEDIQQNKVYYYGFMPYYTKFPDPDHPIRFYTFTKCIRVETGTISYIPEIIKIDMADDVATITYSIVLPATGPYDTAKLYGKKDGNPACDNTDDIVEDLNQVDDEIVVTDIDGDYYFCIQVANGTDTLTSDVVSCSGEAYSGNNGFAVSDETMLAFDGSSWYNAHTDFRRYNFDGSDTWRDISYSLDLKARYFGMVTNNIRFDIKNIQITYTISGETKTKYLDELLLDSTLSNVIHYNTEVTGAWPACLSDQVNTCQVIGNVQADNQHLIHFGRPNYNVMGLTYDSTNRMYSIINNTDIHADCYVLPLKKKYHITGISYSCRRQANDPGWGAWKGASISFANATTV